MRLLACLLSCPLALCSCGRVSGPAPHQSQGEKEVSEVDIKEAQTWKRRKKSTEGRSNNEKRRE